MASELHLPQKGAGQMFSAAQYRAKVAEYRTLLTNTPCSANATSEFRNLEQIYTTLADDEEWMEINVDNTIKRRKLRDIPTHLAEEHTLRCLAAAVTMHWNAVPTKLQRELFDSASAIGDQQPAA